MFSKQQKQQQQQFQLLDLKNTPNVKEKSFYFINYWKDWDWLCNQLIRYIGEYLWKEIRVVFVFIKFYFITYFFPHDCRPISRENIKFYMYVCMLYV